MVFRQYRRVFRDFCTVPKTVPVVFRGVKAFTRLHLWTRGIKGILRVMEVMAFMIF